MIKHVENQTPELCLEAVWRTPSAIKYVKNQTPELCLEAIKLDPWCIQHIREQTEELCLAAVRKRGLTLRHVREQTPKICLAAVKQNGLALAHVRQQTPEICLEAVRNKSEAIKHIRGPMKLNESQVINEALDLYARMGTGQLEISVDEFLRKNFYKDYGEDLVVVDGEVLRKSERVRQLINEIKLLVFGHSTDESWGIYNSKVPSSCQEAFRLRTSGRAASFRLSQEEE